MITEMTESEFKQSVKDTQPFDLSDLIGPDDVHDGAETWQEIPDEVMRQELYINVEVIMSEITHYGHADLYDVVYDYCIQCLREDMSRAPMSDLAFEDRQKAVSEGYWLYEMDKWEVTERLHEEYESIMDIPYEVYSHVHMLAEGALIAHYTPEGVDI